MRILKNFVLAQTSSYGTDGSRDAFGMHIDDIPVSKTRQRSGFDGADNDDDGDSGEDAESRLALSVISTLFGLVIVAVLAAAIYFVGRKSGMIKRAVDRTRSLPLQDMEDAGDGSGPDTTTPPPDVERSEKAFSKLGLRMSYQRSRRVL